MSLRLSLFLPCLLVLSWPFGVVPQSNAQSSPIALKLQTDDVVPTGNEWIALPDIRASDGALGTFNVLSMARRGLLQAGGEQSAPVLAPYFKANGKSLPFLNPAWTLDGYWIPTARLRTGDLEASLTWCAPPGSRAAFLRLTLTNLGAAAVPVSLGVRASFGSLSRVTYVPVELHGARTVSMAPWVSPGEAFSFITDDTEFAWSLIHPGSEALITQPPLSLTPAADASRSVNLAPGATAESLFILGAGIEEFSAAHNAKALREILDREGADSVLREAAAYFLHRTRTTGQADLDLLMNRNLLFTDFYAWGKTIDTEQRVGVTSRSPRYYVSAAYWDRDAMLWSFPGLLDSDPDLAREALEYALTVQLRNTGTHSRFIDGVVLEDGFQLDEAAAPIIALAAYMRARPDAAFLHAHEDAMRLVRDKLLARYDARTGLYSSLQDSQDEYQKLPFLTYDNVLTWKAFEGLHDLFTQLGHDAAAAAMGERATALHAAILQHSVSRDAPGADGPMFASATDGEHAIFTEIPPGALMRLPSLGFIAEDDPLFARTYRWLHSKQYKYGYADQPYGLPGSYRVDFTTSWAVADHLQLKAGKDQALKILHASNWDGGIITEGVDPATGRMDQAGRAFATAAGYVAHGICAMACKPAQAER